MSAMPFNLYTRGSPFDVMQSLRKDNIFCDIKLETDDGSVVRGHKVVLASTSPYFRAMFTNFLESNKDCVIIKGMDSTSLILLVDFIYTSQIMVTEENVLALLPASKILQLEYVQIACCNFLQSKLHPTNCLGIKAFADLHDCLELLSSSDTYARQHFLEVVKGDEFLSLSSEQVIKLISSDKLTVPSEKQVFECVIRWVNHNLSCRKNVLPNLMKHVRLALVPEQYFFERVSVEPLLENSDECKVYITEAKQFHLLRSQYGILPKLTICTTPRQPVDLPKILTIGISAYNYFTSVKQYDPSTNTWKSESKFLPCRFLCSFTVLKDSLLFAIGGYNPFLNIATNGVDMLDLSLPSSHWVPTVPMCTERIKFGVAVLNDFIYAVGGEDVNSRALNSAEMFDINNQKWIMIANMSIGRRGVYVVALNNFLYAIGGCQQFLSIFKSVECYNPFTNTWMPVAEMSVGRLCAGVAVLNDVIYVVGGHDRNMYVFKSVEAYCPSTNVWTTVAEMHFSRMDAGVFALNGLLYVMGGKNTSENDSELESAEVFDPNTNTWTLLSTSINCKTCFSYCYVLNNDLKYYRNKP